MCFITFLAIYQGKLSFGIESVVMRNIPNLRVFLRVYFYKKDLVFFHKKEVIFFFLSVFAIKLNDFLGLKNVEEIVERRTIYLNERDRDNGIRDACSTAD